MSRIALAAALLLAGAAVRAQVADARYIPQAESGEDAAPEGIVSRASGRPDHPRSLAEIVKSGYLRVLTRNNDTSFFIYRGHRMGFDYEVGKKLAQSPGIRPDMIIPQSWAEMVPALLKGEGDVISAAGTATHHGSKHGLP